MQQPVHEAETPVGDDREDRRVLASFPASAQRSHCARQDGPRSDRCNVDTVRVGVWSVHARGYGLIDRVQVILGEPAIPGDWQGQLAKLCLDAIDNAFALFLKSKSCLGVRAPNIRQLLLMTQSRGPALTVRPLSLPSLTAEGSLINSCALPRGDLSDGIPFSASTDSFHRCGSGCGGPCCGRAVLGPCADDSVSCFLTAGEGTDS